MGTKWDKAKNAIKSAIAIVTVAGAIGLIGSKLYDSSTEEMIKNELTPREQTVLFKAVEQGLTESERGIYARSFARIQRNMDDIDKNLEAANQIIAKDSTAENKDLQPTHRTFFHNRMMDAKESLDFISTNIEELDKPAFDEIKKELFEGVKEREKNFQKILDAGEKQFKV